MTTMELNAELFRQLSIIAEDESLMRKAVKAVTRLAKQKETEETEYIGKEEILKGIDAGLKEMVERKHSGNKAKTLEELINELLNRIRPYFRERSEAVGQTLSFIEIRHQGLA